MADSQEGQNVAASDKRKRRRWPWVMAVLVAFLVWNYWPAESTITISPETTYITEPLNPDGTVNYFQALVDRASEGVTPDNNAAVLLVRAVGPAIFEEEVRAESLKQLGLTEEELEKDKPYFEKFEDYYLKHGPKGKAKEDGGSLDPRDILWELQLTRRPWSVEDYPLAAAWLAANEGPLQLVNETAGRERAYFPLIARDDPPVLPPSHSASLASRRAMQALAARAMLKMDKGDVDGAWDDILVISRFGRKLAASATLVDSFVGLGIEHIACHGSAALVADSRTSARHLRTMLVDLHKLPPIATLDTALEVERFATLDFIMVMHRRGVGVRTPEPRNTMEALARRTYSVDWDEVLEVTNRWWTNDISMWTAESYVDHRRQFEENWGPMTDVGNGRLYDRRMVLSGLAGRLMRGFRTRRVMLNVPLMIPNLVNARRVWESRHAEGDILVLALAAKLYKAERGDWPADLAALAPEYVAAIPADRFTGEALRYVRGEDGVTIYSLGPNMTDDGGVNVMELPFGERDGIPEDADDIAITVR
ncbi:MAG: hypothetical protein ACYS8X_11115 [Planctomycetota bacterium]|jgi:hypothetical protein